MDVDLALLCDAATIDGAGKLNILGIFDRIGVQSFPARHGRLTLVLRFSAGLNEASDHELVITMHDPEEEELVRADGNLQLGAGAARARHGIKVPQILNFDGVVFKQAGAYRFDVEVDGEHAVSVPLQVIEAPGARA